MDGRPEKTSFILIDSQSVQNTETTEEKGYDAGKKVSGIKRHLAVDTNGLPHAIHVTTANVTDRVLWKLFKTLSTLSQKLLSF